MASRSGGILSIADDFWAGRPMELIENLQINHRSKMNHLDHQLQFANCWRKLEGNPDAISDLLISSSN